MPKTHQKPQDLKAVWNRARRLVMKSKLDAAREERLAWNTKVKAVENLFWTRYRSKEIDAVNAADSLAYYPDGDWDFFGVVNENRTTEYCNFWNATQIKEERWKDAIQIKMEAMAEFEAFLNLWKATHNRN